MRGKRRESMSSPRDWARSASSDHVVVVAASAGGLAAVSTLLASLPADFPAAIVVVQHRAAGGPDILPALIARRTPLAVRAANDGDVLEPGVVYVCPAGKHVVTEHALRIVDGPPLDHVRPSANVLLASVAHTYGERAIGVVLSGNGSDGATGCLAVSRAGGTVIAQEPASATNPDMPSAAAQRSGAVHVLEVERMGSLLSELVRGSRRAAPRSARAEMAPRTTTPIRVVLADDHRIILDGLRTLLGTEDGIEVVGEAEDGASTVDVARRLAPNVVVLDIGMPVMDGIEATRQIRSQLPETQVLVLTAFVDEKRADKILESGAVGCLSKDAAYAELATAIREAAAGNRYFSSRMAAVFARARDDRR